MCEYNVDRQLMLDRVKSINDNIKRNLEVSGLDFGELMDCYIDLATYSSSKITYVPKSGYSRYIEDTYNRIILGDSKLLEARNSMNELIIMSKISSSKLYTKHSFFDEAETREMFDLFQKMVKMGCYQVPVLKQDREDKKYIISTVVSLASYIWSKKQFDKAYQYDDSLAFDTLKRKYDDYVMTRPMSIGNKVGCVYDKDGIEIIDTDRADDLLFASVGKFMDYIESNYKYADESSNIGAMVV